MELSARGLDFKKLNDFVRSAAGDVTVRDCCGQRFLASGRAEGRLTVYGTPGNALGAYLDGSVVRVHGNVQDAVGDTMNGGQIIVNGSAGDALGYAMRGGEIFIRGDVGYRAGIHMKEYGGRKPVLVIGGRAGSFLGEYMAGGLIIVLGLGAEETPLGNFTGAGMHGGRIFVRASAPLPPLPAQVAAAAAGDSEREEIAPYLGRFADYFGVALEQLMGERFYVLRPNGANPYRRLYAAN
ncbi:MAG: glutamate synthase [Clostridia bacterium]|nr:glutamate synthase [Clostridia bacterium]